MLTIATILLICGIELTHPIRGLDRWSEALRAISRDEDPTLVLAISMVESRLDLHAKSPKGAVGPMQVLPHIWAPKIELRCRQTPKKCVMLNVQAGVRALKVFRHRCGPKVRRVLQGYNSGSCTGNPVYARDVLKRYRYIQSLLDVNNEDLSKIPVGTEVQQTRRIPSRGPCYAGDESSDYLRLFPHSDIWRTCRKA